MTTLTGSDLDRAIAEARGRKVKWINTVDLVYLDTLEYIANHHASLDPTEHLCAARGWELELVTDYPLGDTTKPGIRRVQIWSRDGGYTSNADAGADTATKAARAVLAALRGEWISYEDAFGIVER